MNTNNTKSTLSTLNVLNENDVLILQTIIEGKGNVIITGESLSGKTTFLSYLLTLLPAEEKILMYDFYSEIRVPNRTGKTITVGYKDGADIKGSFNLVEFQEMIRKSLLLPFDRIIADELYGTGIEEVFNSLHLGRSGYFTVPGDSAENALKFLFLKTIYPFNKTLSTNDIKEVEKVFQYAITLNKDLIIEKLVFTETGIEFEKIN